MSAPSASRQAITLIARRKKVVTRFFNRVARETGILIHFVDTYSAVYHIIHSHLLALVHVIRKRNHPPHYLAQSALRTAYPASQAIEAPLPCSLESRTMSGKHRHLLCRYLTSE